MIGGSADSRLLALRARQRGSFTLPIPPAEAFDLFTPDGERRWVAGWEPVILSACGATEPGAVFLTEHRCERTIWTLLEIDRGAGANRLFARVTRSAGGHRQGAAEPRQGRRERAPISTQSA